MKVNGFQVVYKVTCHASEAEKMAKGIALEQTVELPESVIKDPFVQERVVGSIMEISKNDASSFLVSIEYDELTIGDDLVQLLNVIFGNSSIMNNIKVHDIRWNDEILKKFKGPKFGVEGLRNMFGSPDGPMLCTALKPVGFSSDQLGELTYQFALGGVHIIKDDHGLANQDTSPFKERVEKCTAAAARANRETGGHSIYCPSVSTRFDRIREYADFAVNAGAGALLFAPAMCGWDTMRWLSGTYDIPIISHPTFGGANILSETEGFSRKVYFGDFQRLAGADGVIYPNFGGRFGFTQEECLEIADGCNGPMRHIKTAFPMPGGGMRIDNALAMKKVYKNNVIYLMGGGLYEWGSNLSENVKALLKALS